VKVIFSVSVRYYFYYVTSVEIGFGPLSFDNFNRRQVIICGLVNK